MSSEIIGPYTLGRKLGQGHFAKVKMGEDKLKNKVAIKIFDKVSIVAQQATSNYTLAHIERELNALRLCSPHPYIASMNEVLETNTHVYFVMEYVSGGELYDYIVSEGRLEEGEACRLFYQLAHAVQYCHSKDIAHRDLKPENILLDSKLNCRIVDFGLASWPGENYKSAEGGETEVFLKTQCGSPEYAAPEVLRASAKGSFGYRGNGADVWSLGVVLYAMLVGSLPFTAPNVRMVIENILHGSFVVPTHLSQPAQMLLKAMLVVDPTKRIPLKQCLEHAWVKKFSPKEIVVRDDKPLNQRLNSFKISGSAPNSAFTGLSFADRTSPLDFEDLDNLSGTAFAGISLGDSKEAREASEETLRQKAKTGAHPFSLRSTQQVWLNELDENSDNEDVGGGEESGGGGGGDTSQDSKSETKLITDEQRELMMKKKALDQQMFRAADTGDLAAMQQLIVNELVDLRRKSIDNFTPMHYACRKGHLPIVQCLLGSLKPLSIDANTKSGWTPLMMAADQGHKAIVQALLPYGANIHHKNDNGKSAIMLARERQHTDIAQLLTTASSNRTKKSAVPSLQFQFFQAAEDGDLGHMRYLIQLSKDLCKEANSNSVEHVAQRKHAKIHLNGRGIDNWTVLHFAARKGQVAVCQQMVTALGAKYVDAPTKSGWTPLMMAADRGHAEVVQLLIRHKASLTLKAEGKTVKEIAAAAGQNLVVAMLENLKK